MRIISRKIIRNFWKKYPETEQPLKSWFAELSEAKWDNPNELKRQFGSASIISNRRVVFNIKGNSYRIVTDIEYSLKIVFIIWIGTHNEYDKINVREVKYVKTNKK